MKLALAVALVALFPLTSAAAQDGCRCPAEAQTRTCLAATPDHRLIACGDELARHGTQIRAGELEIFANGKAVPSLSFDAVQENLLSLEGDSLRVVLLSKLPAGRHWGWKEVQIAEWIVTPSASDPPPHSLFPKALVSKGETVAFLKDYRRWLADRKFDRDEEMLGRLAMLAMSGNATAQQLFATIDRDAGLDGAMGEESGYYW